MQILDEVLFKSDLLRPGYSHSLGPAANVRALKAQVEALGITLPQEVADIYSRVTGTLHQIRDQKFMDFFPGFRLIHAEEMAAEVSKARRIFSGAFPVLADYSGNYFALLQGSGDFSFLDGSDRELVKAAQGIERFLATMSALYDGNVYSLDQYGFLQSDFTREGEIASKLNPNCPFWNNN